MMMNIFSNFDLQWYNMCLKESLLIIPIMMTTSMFWYGHNKLLMAATMPVTSYMVEQLAKTKLKTLKSMMLISSSLFIFLIYMNMSGLLPYSFSTSSQIIFTLSIGLPMWMLTLISSTLYSMKKTISHLLPDGAPMWLNPFLVMIETVSILVRPLTLSFRLAANMTAGHVILTLMMSFSTTAPLMKMFLVTTVASSMYIIFEMGICMIQAYIFCLLISLYTNDHT